MIHGTSTLNQAQRAYDAKECRVDPEHMLQEARLRREGLHDARSHLHALAKSRFVALHGDQFLIALGQIEIDILSADETIAHWLAEIDKGA